MSLKLIVGPDCFLYNTNYYSNDLKDAVKESPHECQSWCQKTVGCVHFTWISSSSSWVGGRKLCLLKKQKDNHPSATSGHISGPRYCGNKRFKLIINHVALLILRCLFIIYNYLEIQLISCR